MFCGVKLLFTFNMFALYYFNIIMILNALVHILYIVLLILRSLTDYLNNNKQYK